MDNPAGTIVVGYDGSDSAGLALDWAAAEAQRRGLPLTVLNVLDYLRMTPGPRHVMPWPYLNEEAIARIVTEGATRARETAPTIEIAAVAESGPVARVLIAASRRAELIVLGTRGRGSVAATVLGSVSAAVSAHAECTVVVVRGACAQPPGPRRAVVVGVDGSSGADVALRFAADTAAGTGARLLVVSAYRPAPLRVWAGSSIRSAETDEDVGYDVEARTIAHRTVLDAGQTARTLHPELEVRGTAVPGSVAQVLVTASRQAGLVVLGAEGRSGLTGLIPGSVGQRVLQTALCPVAIVRGAAA